MNPLKRLLGVLALALALTFAPGVAQATVVRILTPMGPIDVTLLDQAVPTTVNNFLSYVRDGAYSNTFIHRSVSVARGGIGIIQGGGFTWIDAANAVPGTVPAKPAIVLEASNERLNARGTIAMARTNAPNSATSQWFINVADNSTSLGVANGGGYAVFGRVSAPGMVVADAIAAMRTVQATGCGAAFGAMSDLPTAVTVNTCAQINSSALAMVNGARELPTTAASSSDRVFNYLEAAYPQYAAPASPATLEASGYVYRYYAKTNAYVGTKDGNVYYLVPSISPDVTLLGSLASWLAVAVAAGY
jgi:peptidyl-prolyl cis-trans isomerase A (cyclophilin A)